MEHFPINTLLKVQSVYGNFYKYSGEEAYRVDKISLVNAINGIIVLKISDICFVDVS